MEFSRGMGDQRKLRTEIRPASYERLASYLPSWPFSAVFLSLSSVSHSLNAFCRWREFHCKVLEMLLTQSSLRRPGGITLANG
jgi:hypothetical protein